MAECDVAERPDVDLTDMNDDLRSLRERALVLRAQLGDRDAFDQLVTLYQERLSYYVHRLVQDWHQSRDILQQVWFDVFCTLRNLRSPSAFRVWLYRIAHDRSITCIRRQRVESDVHERLVADVVETEVWNDLELLENAEVVHIALNRLSVIHREIMTLRFLEDMNVREIARVMQCSEGTAKSRLHYAKDAMRRIISEERDHA